MNLCKNCIYYPKGLRDHDKYPPPRDLQRNAYCEIKYINHVIGEEYMKKCIEKNIDGKCQDFKESQHG